MQFTWLIIVFAFIGFWLFMRKKALAGHAQMEQKDERARVGEIAKRLGLSVVAGDPNFNLMHTGRWKDLGDARGTTGHVSRPDIEVTLQGESGGRATQLIYVDKIRVQQDILSREIHRWFDARLIIKVRAPFPDFEIYTRNPNEHARPEPQLALVPQSFGDAALDSQYILKTGDPRVGAAVAEALKSTPPLWYTHFIGTDGTIAFRAVEHSAPLLGDAEKILMVLDEMASAIEKAASAHTSQPG